MSKPTEAEINRAKYVVFALVCPLILPVVISQESEE